ncbi:hypothetical protein SUGI_0241750 [Cryptomeria japonica]|nr:hypothetical protein SUGI_0241750 [Cryptomeria japonica]
MAPVVLSSFTYAMHVWGVASPAILGAASAAGGESCPSLDALASSLAAVVAARVSGPGIVVTTLGGLPSGSRKAFKLQSGDRGFIAVCCAISVKVNKEIKLDIEYNVYFFIMVLSVGSAVFGPVFLSCMIGSSIIGNPLFLDNLPLKVKPWHPDFNPFSETFNKISVWIRLPYLPLHLWANSLFEEVGNSLRDFQMMDDDSYNFLHSTFSRILVELDVSKGLPTKIVISSSKGS